MSFSRWFSPSRPLDPSIFYYLENFSTISHASSNSEKYAYGQLKHRCNRKLLFHLVDEMLVEILKPCMNMKSWAASSSGSGYSNNIAGKKDVRGSHLIDLLCSKVRSFPCTDCRVLEDIDALVEKDMPLLKLQNDVAFVEVEGIVTELEKDLLDSIIHETATIFYGDGVSSIETAWPFLIDDGKAKRG